jgi:hypothetical protein
MLLIVYLAFFLLKNILLFERKIVKSFDLDLILDNSISLRLPKMQF